MNPLKSLARGTYRGINSIGSAIGNAFNPAIPYTPMQQSPAPMQKRTPLTLTNPTAPPTVGFHRTLPNIPSYKKGGKVEKTGLAYLHKGETVIPKDMDYKEKFFKSVQNYGEQHPYFHSREMNQWRKNNKKGDPDVYAKARTKAMNKKIESEGDGKRMSRGQENLKGKELN